MVFFRGLRGLKLVWMRWIWCGVMVVFFRSVDRYLLWG